MTVAGTMTAAMAAHGETITIGNGELPIVGTGTVNGTSYIDDRTAAMMKEAGLNTVTFMMDYTDKLRTAGRDTVIRDVPYPAITYTLEAAKRHGLGVMVRICPPVLKSAEDCDGDAPVWIRRGEIWGDIVRHFAEDKTVTGWQLTDEPSAALFEGLATCRDSIEANDPYKRTVYVNLYPYSDDANQLNGILPADRRVKDYERYLERFEEVFDPAIWSYDKYAISRDGNFRFVRGDFFQNLMIYRDLSRRTGRPFLGYVLAMQVTFPVAPGHPKETGYWLPDAGSMRYEAFHALAFGAKGLFYWTMTQREPNRSGDGTVVEEYPTAPIDLEGRKTLVFDDVRRVNREIREVAQVFYEGEVTDVRVTGDPFHTPEAKDYIGLRILKNGKNFGPIKRIVKQEKGVTLSLISNGGKQYLAVVSLDFASEQRVEIEFKTPVRAYGSDEEGTLRTTLTLPPGGCRVLECL